MAVIDIRQNPMVDMANAQAIGNILGAIGRAETLRKKKYDMDTMMANLSDPNKTPEQAIQATRATAPAPYDTGVKGIWQGVGNILSFGARPDVTEDAVDMLLKNNLQQSIRMRDPMYQAQLEGMRTSTAGAKQQQEQSAGLYPAQKTAAESRAKVSSLEAQAAPTQIEQSLTAGELSNQAKQMQLGFEKQLNPIKKEMATLGLESTKDQIERERELNTRGKILEDLKVRGLLSDQAYQTEIRPLQVKAQELENDYRKAMSEYTARRGTSMTAAQRASVLKNIQEAINGGMDDTTAEAWQDIASEAGYSLEKSGDGYRVRKAGSGEQNTTKAVETPIAATPTPPAAAGVKRIKNKAEWDALKKGEQYIDADGKVYTKQ